MLPAFLTKKTRNTVKNITRSELNHPSLSKRSTGCNRQDIGRERSILLCVTHMLCVSQVRYSVSRCVTGGSCPFLSFGGMPFIYNYNFEKKTYTHVVTVCVRVRGASVFPASCVQHISDHSKFGLGHTMCRSLVQIQSAAAEIRR